jgi:type I restriction enzyme S subunit
MQNQPVNDCRTQPRGDLTPNFKGDLFFTRTSETTEEVGIASVMLDEPTETVFSGFVLRARPLDDRLTDRFKAYCFSAASVRKQITSKASYTTRALTNGRTLSEVELPLPTKPEQTAIAAVLTDMDTELSALEARRDKTRALKQGMMQELLTGRTRLVATNEAETQA